MIDISGLDRASVIQALYEAAVGLDPLFRPGPETLPRDEAEELVGTKLLFVRGRTLNVTIDGDSIEEWLYDRHNGAGSAERAIRRLRASIPAHDSRDC